MQKIIECLNNDCFDEAIKLFDEYLASIKGTTYNHLETAQLAEKLGKTRVALQEYQQASQELPDDPFIFNKLATLYSESGILEKAISCQDKSVQLQPDNMNFKEDLILLYLNADMASEASKRINEWETQQLDTDFIHKLRQIMKQCLESHELESHETQQQYTSIELMPDFSDENILRFFSLFSGRENIYARQWWDTRTGKGGYTPVHEPFTFQVAKNHLLGNVTVGIYPLRFDNTINFAAFDIDINKRALEKAYGDKNKIKELRKAVSEETERIKKFIESMGIIPVIEDSGYKGRHIWLLFQQPIDGDTIFNFGKLFLKAHQPYHPDIHLEFFPKQPAVSTGVGNLIKLPLGMHRRTGRWSFFYDPVNSNKHPEPLTFIRIHPRISPDIIYNAILFLKQIPYTTPTYKGLSDDDSLIDSLPVPQAEPAWSEAHFDSVQEIKFILDHCEALKKLVQNGLTYKKLSYGEQIVLRHTLGYIPSGMLAVNWLFTQCANVSIDTHLKSLLKGNPISCPKIRKHISSLTAQVNCNCIFPPEYNSYPHPLLYLRQLNPSVQVNEQTVMSKNNASLEETASAYAMLLRRSKEIEKELEELRVILINSMKINGTNEIKIDCGKLILQDCEGIQVIEWIPDTKEKT